MQNLKGINISVGRSCFVQCLGCYNHFGKNKNVLPVDIILGFLKFLKKECSVSKVTLCGGDPLSRPDIMVLLEKIKTLDFFITLDTVGTPLLSNTETIFYGMEKVNKVDPKALVELVDLIGIPIDGDSNESFAAFRKKRPKIFDEQLSILEKLDLHNANVCINTVAHKDNIHIIKNIYDIIKSYNAIKKWQIFQFMPIGPLGFKTKISLSFQMMHLWYYKKMSPI